ncbi:hypothetical protein [uncultured Actinomyces sp.]|uniref:hypothetical protein n=1 Tax=uncultured Actinomyces sp. TaxID=249061 RepID=UPI00288C0441|nr:hypothetical protein [uncultured Actinomyces sp.]
MGPVIIAIAVLFALCLAGWAASALAVRVDRLHRQVLGSRATLETQLVHRAQAAVELAASSRLDPASALLVSRAAHEALEAEGPLVDDRLDSASPREDPGNTDRSRAAIESDLTRVLRTVLTARTRAELSADPLSGAALARLDKTAHRMVLARRFHNIHVAETRRLRATWPVRMLHLAGRAPQPATFDMDDDITPEPSEEDTP